ncbi:MAG: formimidoylglutamate deiminase [Rhodospirillaceae bacterium]|nr:formimidoylglutamate deiminase [Rhodospirillaceae bacterium]
MSTNAVFAESALLPDGWAQNVLIEIAPDGDVAAVTKRAVPGAAERAAGTVIPGMPNLHSHAFQRAMAGLTEQAGQSGTAAAEDSFWTWRTLMYDFVNRLTPAQVEAIAAQLYVEMLKSGYTAVAEFHYLHHDADGRAYGDLAEMSERIIAAAKATGIGLTHLPVLYGAGGFGGKPAGTGQRRFLNDPARFLRLIEGLQSRHRDDPQIRIGIAPHSLRAVTPEMLQEAVAGLNGLDPTAPIHIHIAEQTKEVEDCLAWTGLRPIEWLLAQQRVDQRWCLIHATHMTTAETDRLAASGAVAGLCPTTEANLGDGLFPAAAYLAREGRFGIGSDSHISVSPIEELRWLEYGQRLATRRRNVLSVRTGEPHVGGALYRAALAGGAQAAARDIGRIAPGARADLVVLDAEAPTLLGKSEDTLLDAVVFAGNVNPVRDVMVGGRWVVEDGHHIAEHAVLGRFRGAMAALLG